MKYYKDTDYPILPHFGISEMSDMLSSGLISIQSHTYDMHQWAAYENSKQVRPNILPLSGETEQQYISALKNDFKKQQELLNQAGAGNIEAVAYPYGTYNAVSEAVLKSLGVKITLSTDRNHINSIIKGVPQSLFLMGRLSINDDLTEEEILAYLGQ